MDRTVTIEGRKYPETVDHVCTDTICGIRVPVLRADKSAHKLLHDSYGCFCEATATIYVLRGQPETQERDTLQHERGHAFLTLSGLSNLLRSVVKWRKGYEDFEECAVRLAAPHLASYRTETFMQSLISEDPCDE